jgi:hypothetical protein
MGYAGVLLDHGFHGWINLSGHSERSEESKGDPAYYPRRLGSFAALKMTVTGRVDWAFIRDHP